MKKLLVFALVSGAIAFAAFLGLNALGFRPLELFGNDPNSNAMLVAIAYAVVGAVLIGIRAGANGSNIIARAEYARKGYAEDLERQDSRLPYGLALVAWGIVFIVIYFALNRATFG